MARLAISLGLAGPRRAPIEARLCGWRFGPKSVCPCGMRINVSVHRVNSNKMVSSYARARISSDAESLVHKDAVVDVGNDIDEWAP